MKSVADPYVQVRSSLRLANDGNMKEAVKLWNMGNLIEKNEELRALVPLELRVNLLERAAKSGDAEACYDYAVYNLDVLSNETVFIDYIVRSSDKGYIAAKVVRALVEFFVNNKAADAQRIIDQIRKIASPEWVDVFDASITHKSLDLVMEAFDSKSGMESLRVEARKKNELELVGCIRLTVDYKELFERRRGIKNK